MVAPVAGEDGEGEEWEASTIPRRSNIGTASWA